MIDVAGIFDSRSAAEQAVERLRRTGMQDEHLALLAPGVSEEKVEEAVKAAEMEHTGEKIGVVVGRGLGIAGAIMVGGAVGSFFIPGVGAVLAAGVLGAALLGTGGAVIGRVAGSAVDEVVTPNLSHGDFHLYEAALREGRTVLFAVAKDEEQAAAVRQELAEAGAESLESLSARWWSGLRGAEAEAYTVHGRDFGLDEQSYRRGFEAALHPAMRGRALAEVTEAKLRERYGEDYGEEAFRRGYKRGQAHHASLVQRLETEGHERSVHTPDA